MVSFGNIRYSYPVFQFLIILAVVGLLYLFGKDGNTELPQATSASEKLMV